MASGLMFAPLSSSQTLALTIVGLAAIVVTIIVVTTVVADLWKRIHANRITAELTRQMLDRGFGGEEVRAVLLAQGRAVDGLDGANLPCASEVVVESDGDWYPALVLQAVDGRYHIHYVGHGMDENEWVGADRVRFPAGSELPNLTASDPANPGHTSNGRPVKQPLEMEL